MKKTLMVFFVVCTLHAVLDAEIIPKNASGIIIWSDAPDTGYKKIQDEPLDALYKKYKIALFIPADKIAAYYWEEQVFSLPRSYVCSVRNVLYIEHSRSSSFFSFLIDGKLIFSGVNRCRLIDSAAGIPEGHLRIPFLRNIMMYEYSKEYIFFTFSLGCFYSDINSQTFYEARRTKNIYYEPLHQYFTEKKKIIEGHIDIDHLIRKGEIVPITAEEIEKKLNYKPDPDNPIEYNTE